MNIWMKKYLFVISGPSAVGKTSVLRELLLLDSSIKKITTCTTRLPRNSEQNGIDYFFLSHDEFKQGILTNDFIEYSEVYGNFYGVKLSTINTSIKNHSNCILTLNWEGFSKLKNSLIDVNVFGFFLIPPSIEELERRISSRNTDDSDNKKRLAAAKEDISHANLLDFVVENKNISSTAQIIFDKIRSITT